MGATRGRLLAQPAPSLCRSPGRSPEGTLSAGSEQIQFFKANSYRSDRQSVLHRPLPAFANKWLNIAILWELALLIAILYVPFLQNLFDTFGLSTFDWLVVGAASFTVVPVLELAKFLERRGAFGKLD